MKYTVNTLLKKITLLQGAEYKAEDLIKLAAEYPDYSFDLEYQLQPFQPVYPAPWIQSEPFPNYPNPLQPYVYYTGNAGSDTFTN